MTVRINKNVITIHPNKTGSSVDYKRSENVFDHRAYHFSNSCNSVSQMIDNSPTPKSKYIAPNYAHTYG